MTPEVADVLHALEIGAKSSAAGLPAAAKAEDLAALATAQNLLDAMKSDRMVAFDATQEHRGEGHVSAAAWLKSRCRMEGRDAARWQRTARFTKTLPRAAEALARGEITLRHVEALHRAQLQAGEEAFALAEEVLVDAAIEQRFSDFARTLEYFVVRVQPRDAETRARRDLEDRFASSSRTFGGNGVVDAQLEPIGFTVWDAELGRLYQFLLERDRVAARDRLGRRPLESELGRTARQRRADAMVLMSERSAAFGDDELPPSRFTLIVHADAELAAKLIQFVRDEMAAAAEDPDVEPDLGSIEYGGESLHELDDGTVVTVNTVLLALLTGVIRGVLWDPDGIPTRFGHGKRLFTDDQAILARARFRRCCHPYGCDRTAPFLHTDHLVEHQDGGPTDIDNAAPKDAGHNQWKSPHRHDPPRPGVRLDTNQRRGPPRWC
jgi:hypothetical protein